MKSKNIFALFLAILLAFPLVLAQEAPEQLEYNELRAEYRDFRDDYSYYSRRYEQAVDDEDTADMRYYGRELDDVHDNLGELDDEVDDLIDDVEGNSSIPNQSYLLDDLDKLEDDIRGLQRRIVDLIDEDEEYLSQLIVQPPAEAEEETPEIPAPQLVFVDIDRPAAEEVAVEDGWPETRTLLWLGLGIVIALALIIFLIAVFVA